MDSMGDLSVLTAVPTRNLDLVMRKGIYSQKAILEDPEVMAAFLAQRNADKAWKNDEQYDEKRFREEYDRNVQLKGGDDSSLSGPSVFFTEPDPDKVSDPRHFLNKFDTKKLRVNLSKLLADIPGTRITGAELIPSSAADNMTEEEFAQYVKDRRRDITPEEAAKYIATDPKDLWKHYKDEYVGKYYAADVPHAFIRTPSGIIPPEYLELVEDNLMGKSASDLSVPADTSKQPLYRHRSTLLIRDPETGRLLAAKAPPESKASPFYFPGGGLYADEYDTPRNPSDEDIIEGARREALEELGIELVNPRVVGSYAQELEDWWKEKTLKSRGVPYVGGHEHYVLADRGKQDRSLYNIEGDAFEQGDYHDPSEIVEALSRVAKGDSTFAAFNREQVRAIKDNLLKKSASDLSATADTSKQPLYRHRASLLIRDPETGRLLAAKDDGPSSFYFPGGGLYADEDNTPRNPSYEDILEGARREALEELGIELVNPRVVGSYAQELDDRWKEKTLKHRGVPYIGRHEHYVLADKGKQDRSLYNIEGDAFEQGDYYDPSEIVEALSRAAEGDSAFAPLNREQVRIIKDNLLKKNAGYNGNNRLDLLTLELLKVAEAGVAKKTDPGKWEAAKREAKSKMGGKHSARAMQLATQIYKKKGGGYKGKEPSSKSNKLKKWTKQDWGWSGEQKKESSYAPDFVVSMVHRSKLAGKGVYLPRRAISALKSTESGKQKLRAAAAEKTKATNRGDQFSSHGLHEGKNRSKLGELLSSLLYKTAAYKDYRPRGTLYLTDGKGNIMADKPTDTYGSIAPYHFPGGGIFDEEKVDRLPTEDEILKGVEREALEELGIKLKNLRALTTEPTNIDMPDWWRERQRKKRGLDYTGISEFYTAAEPGDLDSSILGADNDAFKGNFYPIEEVAAALENSTNPEDPHYNLTMNQAKLIRGLM